MAGHRPSRYRMRGTNSLFALMCRLNTRCTTGAPLFYVVSLGHTFRGLLYMRALGQTAPRQSIVSSLPPDSARGYR
jgi:hypothetical protein